MIIKVKILNDDDDDDGPAKQRVPYLDLPTT